jgi:hypothetical protein
VDDEDNALQPELIDDGLEVVDLGPGSCTVRSWLVGGPPAEEVEGYDPPSEAEMRNQAIVQVEIVRKPVHQDRALGAVVVADVQPMALSATTGSR